uniref:Ubiquitin-like protease family profile domain-containing protein n=1 Tax=Meloidogyne enterolobii TaxID=390850 RepID=A0A6V7VC52_MELEN|nr:unnamed protein product [Meloidogyne enterolobii]
MHFGSLFSLPRGNSERFKPYSTSSPNRLKSVLHKSEWNDFQRRQQLKIPPKTEYLSIQEKMERLKKLIGLTTKDTSKTPTYAQFHFDSNGHSSSNNYPNLRTNNGTSLTGIVRAALFSKNNHYNSSPSVDLVFDQEIIQPRLNHQFHQRMTKPAFLTKLSHKFVQTMKQLLEGRFLLLYQIPTINGVLRELEAELAERELSRHNRKINEQEMLRLRLQVEGLVLERREPPREEFPAIPNNVRQIIRIIWNKSAPPNEVFSSFDGVDIARKDLLTLCGAEWLNDEVINFYINLIVNRSKVNGRLPKVYAFNTYFYVNLSGKGFSSVKRWTKKVDIFDNQMIFVPVHLGNHWCMAVIDFEERKIDYYDSLKADNFTCLELLSNYLAEESMDKRKRPFDMTGWEFTCRKDIPNQGNMWDCGMFSILFAEYASRRAPITFLQQHIPYFRERVVYEILRKELL